jgi:acyl-coenzyme A synthetase/AMP-(fatty) acid ligase
MLYTLIQNSQCRADQMAIVSCREGMSWGGLAERSARHRDALAEFGGQRVGLTLVSSANGIAALAALESLRAHVFLFDGAAPADELRSQALRWKLSTLITAPRLDGLEAERLGGDAALPGSGTTCGGVTILTSGTEGVPKAAVHTWETLLRPVRCSGTAEPQRWLLTYRIHLYAGLQVLLQAWCNRGLLAVAEPADSPDDVVGLMVEHNVEYASATPSYWRRLLLIADRERLCRVPLRQITLGGEIVDQQILDALRQAFPAARMVHIYATTELGRCFSVDDGRAGFPAEFLDNPSAAGVELRVEGGQLWVRSPNAMSHYEGPGGGQAAWRSAQAADWVATGDLVAVRGDRVHFLGRDGDVINVGGNKVLPLEVERIVRSVAGVADVRVFGAPSSLAGQLVACDVVVAAGFDADDVQRSVADRCRRELASHQRPRIVRAVERIELTAAGKTRRSCETLAEGC